MANVNDIKLGNAYKVFIKATTGGTGTYSNLTDLITSFEESISYGTSDVTTMDMGGNTADIAATQTTTITMTLVGDPNDTTHTALGLIKSYYQQGALGTNALGSIKVQNGTVAKAMDVRFSIDSVSRDVNGVTTMQVTATSYGSSWTTSTVSTLGEQPAPQTEQATLSVK